ncbi:Rieske 2Fe-2S domain-containing protein [Pedobacter sp. SD-b]|uniref:Rieske 2Fe-2S domain-containing protein n=1 Tax=Pedobacter segetis TaxID=2793069 RepID=A0ABS1BLU6_9SPHI|nr:Rieske 2Fe-2S domain-containing protein [Pedobacter segetis]
MRWVAIEKHQIKDVELQLITVEGKKICLVKYNSEYFATAAKCPHAGADISQGWCENGFLVCPFHRYKYNLETGRGIIGQGDYIEIYPIKESKDQLLIGVKENWWKRIFGS